MSSKTNDVTLFSNGIGHFRRVYDVPAGEEASISIPFKTDYIGDVAASLQVFGKVRLDSPPSFTPANSNSTSLCIDQSEAQKSLLRQLSGARVSVELRNQSTPQEYTLLGLDTASSWKGDAQVDEDFVVVLEGGTVRRFSLRDVNDITYLEESVQTEINKALKANFQRIKPDSTLLDLALTADAATEAVVQYTIPVAAWKMRYAIREEKGKFNLEGAAIIDNNTDEDWANFRVSVVTGNPISFNTDIATVVVPDRKFVQLVNRVSLGNVDVEEGSGFESLGAAPPQMAGGGGRRGARALRSAAKMSTANVASFGMAACAADDMDYECAQEAAQAPGVDSKEVGDFCIFSCKEPITILARKSAVVPMFSTPLTQAGVVLLYKEANNARRPFRAVKFKNETEYSLGRGKTVIYNEGIFSGECVLDNTKPGENRMLPHCLENGMKIVKGRQNNTSVRSSLKLSEGVAVTEVLQTSTTEYTIENKKDELFNVALEHSARFHGANPMVDFSGVEVKEQERLTDSNGWRLYFEVKGKDKLTLTATETHVDRSTVTLGHNWNWVQQNIIDSDCPLSSDPQIVACMDIQKKIDQVADDEQEAHNRVNEVEQKVARVRANLESAKDVAGGSKVDKWITDLDASEEEIRTLQEEKLPALREQRQRLYKELAEALANVTATWKAETPKAVD